MTSTSTPAQTFDIHYQRAFQATLDLSGLLWTPCSAMVGGEHDYRYMACFRDDSGSAAPTMQRMRQVIEQAGFVLAETGSQDSDLDASFTLPGTHYTLNTSLTATGVQWMAYEKGQGKVAPRAGIDAPGVPYALMSPAQFVQLQGMQYLNEAVPGQAKNIDLTQVKPCGDSTESSASVCLAPALSGSEARRPLVELYFMGEQQAFAKLDTREMFMSHAEEAVAALVKDGTLPTSSQSSVTVQKQQPGRYTVTDHLFFPGYQLRYEFTAAEGGKVAVKIIATRLKQPAPAQIE